MIGVYERRIVTPGAIMGNNTACQNRKRTEEEKQAQRNREAEAFLFLQEQLDKK